MSRIDIPEFDDMPIATTREIVGPTDRAPTKRRRLLKHKGPGPHPGTKTPQLVHGGGGFTGQTSPADDTSRILNPAQGGATRNKEDVLSYLVNPDGSAPNVSTEGLEDMRQIAAGKTSKIQSRFTDTIQARIDKTMATYGFTDERFDDNMQRLWDSAQDRYAADPSLVDADRFYERWNDILSAHVEQYDDQSFEQIAASAAVISPGLDADTNLAAAMELSDLVAANPELTQAQMVDYARRLEENAWFIRNPIYLDHHKEVVDGLAEVGDPRGPEESVVRLAVATDLESDFRLIRDSDAPRLLDLSHEGQARVAHYLRQETRGAGFNVTKGYTNYANAFAVLQGDKTPDEVLNGIKTRSFYNNILDPFDTNNRRDVTVDFHTINFAGFVLGADSNTHVQTTPSLGGVSLGVRTRVADAVRRLADRQDTNPPLHVQEILWAEWRRGLVRDSNTWVSFDGTVHELGEI